jgi:hypothetical protein
MDHVTATGKIHYHMMDACMSEHGSTIGTTSAALCSSDTGASGCATLGRKAFMLKQFPESERKLYPIGMSKDGHVIWGPFK